MIVRRSRNRASAKATTLSFAVEFGASDVRQMVRDWYNGTIAAFSGIYAPDKARELALCTLTLSEADWLHDFAKHPYFATYPAKYAEMFGAWAFGLALKEGLIKASTAESGKYYLCQVPQKVGRPKEE